LTPLSRERLRSSAGAFLSNTLIAGDLTADGTMAISGKSVSAIGTLYLQSGPLAEGRDVLNGNLTITKDDSLTLSEGNLVVAQGTITGNDSISGRAQIKAGATQLRVDRSWKSAPSVVQVTST
jgi:hypothetical protein